jgi:hypothetical protein
LQLEPIDVGDIVADTFTYFTAPASCEREIGSAVGTFAFALVFGTYAPFLRKDESGVPCGAPNSV